MNEDSHAYFLELGELIDHAIEAIDTYFNMVTDQINLYNTNMSNRANDVMKVLTILAQFLFRLLSLPEFMELILNTWQNYILNI